MKIVEPSVDVIFWLPENGMTVEEAIEDAGRICYQSHHKVCEGSADKFVRMVKKNGHHAILEFGWIVARFIADRGMSHECVRHRLASFAQESTRWCRYDKNKFDSQITVIEPPGLTVEQRMEWWNSMKDAECHYMRMIELGCKSDIARSVLPIGLKTEIIMGANVREWRHVFKERCAVVAHPIIRGLMKQVLVKCYEKMPSIYEDQYDQFIVGGDK